MRRGETGQKVYGRRRRPTSYPRHHLCELFTEGVTLVPTVRKPFDVLAKRLEIQKSRGDRIRTCDLLVPNQSRYQAAPRPD